MDIVEKVEKSEILASKMNTASRHFSAKLVHLNCNLTPIFCALSQLQLNEHAQPIWTEMAFNSSQQSANLGLKTQSQAMRIRNGIVSNDGRSVCTVLLASKYSKKKLIC